jgi:hypothetical protein
MTYIFLLYKPKDGPLYDLQMPTLQASMRQKLFPKFGVLDLGRCEKTLVLRLYRLIIT